MKCHYEVLGIERDADEKTIKNSYRKLALKYHPDKNPENIDEAKEQFLLVQQAYDVLSDPQERAWFDNHRDQILRGRTDYEDESLDVYPYFTAACYDGFGDDESGFYAVYAKVFDQIAAEDIEFMESPEEYEQIPKFGISSSDYESVVGLFYAYWQSYCTKKTYTWLCPHNISEIRNRHILREVEKETKKIAQKKRKERNDEIRALVSFVRKRDKRIQAYRKVLEEKAEHNRMKQQQYRLAQLKKNQQEALEMQKNQSSAFDMDHEEQLRQLERAYGSNSESELDDDDNDEADVLSENDSDDLPDEYYVDDLYCVACNKAFKNISSYENHESSKKHRENAERLKKHMQQEDEEYMNETNYESESELKEIETPIGHTEAKKKSNKKSKKSKAQCEIYTDVEVEDMADLNIGNNSEADKDSWSDDGAKKKKKQKNKKDNKKVTPNETSPALVNDEVQNNTKKVSNKKSNKSTLPISELKGAIQCVTCSSTFESKNKLFAHLKKTNHGVYLPKTVEKVSSRK